MGQNRCWQKQALGCLANSLFFEKKKGLGLFNLKDWNLALLSRILWDFHCKKDSLWVRWVHYYYFRGSDVWNYNISSSNSVLIKKIIQIRNFIISKELSTRKRPKRGFNLGAPMKNFLLTKSMNTLEVSSLLLVGVLLYRTQQSPLRCLSFYGLLKGTGCLLLTKLLF